MGQGGMIMASVPSGAWRHPMNKVVPPTGPRSGGSPSWGAMGGASRGGGGGRSRASQGKSSQRVPKHISRTEYRKAPKFERVKNTDPPSQPARPGHELPGGRHRNQQSRDQDARRAMKKQSRRQPRSERPHEKRSGSTAEGGAQNTPGWDTIAESQANPPDEYHHERDGGGQPHSPGPRKPMPDQQAPGRERPTE